MCEADFFGDLLANERYEVIYERAFLCALPVARRAAWANRVAKLLPPGGMLIGFFYFDRTGKGPPFAIESASLTSLLSAEFELIEERVPADSIAVFGGKERWQVWRRRRETAE